MEAKRRNNSVWEHIFPAIKTLRATSKITTRGDRIFFGMHRVHAAECVVAIAHFGNAFHDQTGRIDRKMSAKNIFPSSIKIRERRKSRRVKI